MAMQFKLPFSNTNAIISNPTFTLGTNSQSRTESPVTYHNSKKTIHAEENSLVANEKIIQVAPDNELKNQPERSEELVKRNKLISKLCSQNTSILRNFINFTNH